jgi:ATP-dependent Zn protease
MHIVTKNAILYIIALWSTSSVYGASTENAHKALEEIVTIMKSAQEKGHQVLILDALLNKLLLRTPSKKIATESIAELDEKAIKALIAEVHKLKKELLDNRNEPYVRRVNAALSSTVTTVNEKTPGPGALSTAALISCTHSLKQLEKNIHEIETKEQEELKGKLDALLTKVKNTFQEQEQRVSMHEKMMMYAPLIQALVIIPPLSYVLYKKVPIIQRFLKRIASSVKRFFVVPPALELSQPRHITFKDIIGLDQPIKKLRTLVTLHLDPKKAEEAQKMGVTLPRGILFEGPPGVGKTMLAKAFANELGSNFFYASAADFHGRWIGEGKARLVSFFDDARRHTPAVIFIDEIDAIGLSREEAHVHQDTKATLNELLTQMDGFKENPGIIVLAATNRANSLDTALLTRFTEKIPFLLPDLETREKILIHYMNQVPYIAHAGQQQKEHFYFLAKIIAQQTAHFSPRELHDLVNNAVRRAFTEGTNTLTDQHFIDTLNDALRGAR